MQECTEWCRLPPRRNGSATLATTGTTMVLPMAKFGTQIAAMTLTWPWTRSSVQDAGIGSRPPSHYRIG